MRRQPLPRQVDARKLTATDVHISGCQPVNDFPRFAAGLCSDSGEVDVKLHFYRDDSHIHRISATLTTDVLVECQRCLKPAPLSIESGFELGIVWTEAQAKALPRELDSVILGEEPLDLFPLIEDELIIETPFTHYHPVGECQPEGPVEYGDAHVSTEEPVENPFAVLKDLKSSD